MYYPPETPRRARTLGCAVATAMCLVATASVLPGAAATNGELGGAWSGVASQMPTGTVYPAVGVVTANGDNAMYVAGGVKSGNAWARTYR